MTYSFYRNKFNESFRGDGTSWNIYSPRFAADSITHAGKIFCLNLPDTMFARGASSFGDIRNDAKSSIYAMALGHIMLTLQLCQVSLYNTNKDSGDEFPIDVFLEMLRAEPAHGEEMGKVLQYRLIIIERESAHPFVNCYHACAASKSKVVRADGTMDATDASVQKDHMQRLGVCEFYKKIHGEDDLNQLGYNIRNIKSSRAGNIDNNPLTIFSLVNAMRPDNMHPKVCARQKNAGSYMDTANGNTTIYKIDNKYGLYRVPISKWNPKAFFAMKFIHLQIDPFEKIVLKKISDMATFLDKEKLAEKEIADRRESERTMDVDDIMNEDILQTLNELYDDKKRENDKKSRTNVFVRNNIFQTDDPSTSFSHTTSKKKKATGGLFDDYDFSNFENQQEGADVIRETVTSRINSNERSRHDAISDNMISEEEMRGNIIDMGVQQNTDDDDFDDDLYYLRIQREKLVFIVNEYNKKKKDELTETQMQENINELDRMILDRYKRYCCGYTGNISDTKKEMEKWFYENDIENYHPTVHSSDPSLSPWANWVINTIEKYRENECIAFHAVACFTMQSLTYSRLERLLGLHLNLMMIGPGGSGKSAAFNAVKRNILEATCKEIDSSSRYADALDKTIVDFLNFKDDTDILPILMDDSGLRADLNTMLTKGVYTRERLVRDENGKFVMQRTVCKKSGTEVAVSNAGLAQMLQALLKDPSKTAGALALFSRFLCLMFYNIKEGAGTENINDAIARDVAIRSTEKVKESQRMNIYMQYLFIKYRDLQYIRLMPPTEMSVWDDMSRIFINVLSEKAVEAPHNRTMTLVKTYCEILAVQGALINTFMRIKAVHKQTQFKPDLIKDVVAVCMEEHVIMALTTWYHNLFPSEITMLLAELQKKVAMSNSTNLKEVVYRNPFGDKKEEEYEEYTDDEGNKRRRKVKKQQKTHKRRKQNEEPDKPSDDDPLARNVNNGLSFLGMSNPAYATKTGTKRDVPIQAKQQDKKIQEAEEDDEEEEKEKYVVSYAQFRNTKIPKLATDISNGASSGRVKHDAASFIACFDKLQTMYIDTYGWVVSAHGSLARDDTMPVARRPAVIVQNDSVYVNIELLRSDGFLQDLWKKALEATQNKFTSKTKYITGIHDHDNPVILQTIEFAPNPNADGRIYNPFYMDECTRIILNNGNEEKAPSHQMESTMYIMRTTDRETTGLINHYTRHFNHRFTSVADICKDHPSRIKYEVIKAYVDAKKHSDQGLPTDIPIVRFIDYPTTQLITYANRAIMSRMSNMDNGSVKMGTITDTLNRLGSYACKEDFSNDVNVANSQHATDINSVSSLKYEITSLNFEIKKLTEEKQKKSIPLAEDHEDVKNAKTTRTSVFSTPATNLNNLRNDLSHTINMSKKKVEFPEYDDINYNDINLDVNGIHDAFNKK